MSSLRCPVTHLWAYLTLQSVPDYKGGFEPGGQANKVSHNQCFYKKDSWWPHRKVHARDDEIRFRRLCCFLWPPTCPPSLTGSGWNRHGAVAKNEVATTMLQGGEWIGAGFEPVYLKEKKIHKQEGREGRQDGAGWHLQSNSPLFKIASLGSGLGEGLHSIPIFFSFLFN